jgi:hypothetical protein
MPRIESPCDRSANKTSNSRRVSCPPKGIAYSHTTRSMRLDMRLKSGLKSIGKADPAQIIIA